LTVVDAVELQGLVPREPIKVHRLLTDLGRPLTPKTTPPARAILYVQWLRQHFPLQRSANTRFLGYRLSQDYMARLLFY